MVDLLAWLFTSHNYYRVSSVSAFDKVLGYLAGLVFLMVIVAVFRLLWGLTELYLSDTDRTDYLAVIKSISLLIVLALVAGYISFSLVG